MGIHDSKTMIKSKTVIGALVAAAPAFDALLANSGLTSVPVLGPLLGDVVTLFGAVVAIIGRVQATARITKVF